MGHICALPTSSLIADMTLNIATIITNIDNKTYFSFKFFITLRKAGKIKSNCKLKKEERGKRVGTGCHFLFDFFYSSKVKNYVVVNESIKRNYTHTLHSYNNV